jgi:hypothetical protein
MILQTFWSVSLSFGERNIFHNLHYAALLCKSNIEMTPLCKVEVTLPRVFGVGEVHRGGGGVDEQAGVQPS